ncbi:putative transglycosidase, GH16 family [Aureobasidium pullulans]|nr:putative transglycosidase, GH16 family [Aureobasidium pullulans]THZ30354.1 putative transglycosidase, GH16 family [Aureobasidium pullulans]
MLRLSQLFSLQASMRLTALATVASLTLTQTAYSQTTSSCNPTQQYSCPADPALSKSVNVDFTSGESDQFTASGSPTYDSNGASFTVAQSGDAPMLTSNWYIMFGKVEVKMKAAPGQGIVSSCVLQSDDLDEIDWEWVGNQQDQVQSIYFRKGDASTSGRGAAFHMDNPTEDFHTYTIDWTSTELVWQVDGKTQRALKATDAGDQYPQTPMLVKLGIWSGGDSSNAPGTIAWAGGNTDYSAGPYTMVVQSIAVTDYSTGKSYSYSDQTGSWTSIKAAGGSINGGSTNVDTSAPAITSVVSGAVPFEGTHRTSTSVSTPGIGNWRATASGMTSTVATTYPGLPSGWTVNGSGKVVPPSKATTGESLDPDRNPLNSDTDQLFSFDTPSYASPHQLQSFFGFSHGLPLVKTLPRDPAS